MNTVDNNAVRRRDRILMAVESFLDDFLDMDLVACRLHRRNAALHLLYKNLYLLSLILMAPSSLSNILREAEPNPLCLIAEVEICDDTFDRLIMSQSLARSYLEIAAVVLSAQLSLTTEKDDAS